MVSIAKLVLLGITTLIFGCSGQSEDTTSGTLSDGFSPVNGPDVPINNGQGINGGLTGRLITNYRSQPYEYDLASGAAIALPLIDTQEFYDLPDGTKQFNFFAAGDGSPNQGFVQNNYECISLPLPGGACLSVFDSNFQAVKRIRVLETEMEEPAKLSPSSRYLLTSEIAGAARDQSIVNLVDIDARNIIDSVVIDNRAPGRDKFQDYAVVEWGQNEEVYYTVPADNTPTVYVTIPGTLDIERTITLPSSYIGSINGLDISPNGDQLLMELRAANDTKFSTIAILNLDTLDVRIPAIDPEDVNKIPIGDDFISQFQNPMWSPDGQYIMFLNSFTSSGSTIVGAQSVTLRDFMVAVPADSNRLVVSGFSNSDAPIQPPAIAIQLADPGGDGSVEINWPSSTTVDKGHIEWIE